MAAARIMVFHLLSPSILMPAASPGVWPSGPWCGLTRLWQGYKHGRIAEPLLQTTYCPLAMPCLRGLQQYLDTTGVLQSGPADPRFGGHGRSSVGRFRHGWRNVATVTGPPEMYIRAGCKSSPMTSRVLIDYQTRGWAERNEPTIQKEYSDIRYVGTEPNPTAGATDWEIASFCIGKRLRSAD